jgi:DNA polymerase I-like protein with 3'-5' exonuclease and polymerase domains
MIYLVTLQQELFDPTYKIIGVDESLSLLSKCSRLQYDSESDGKDTRLNHILCIQFGNDEQDFQMVIDCTTINIQLYKSILENVPLIGQNIKFDLGLLFSVGIIPRRVYDTMIVEQLLYLGYPPKGKYGGIGYSLQDIADRRLGIYIDKTTRGEIIWRGLDPKVVMYAANDVKYLEKIMDSQLEDCRNKHCLVGARIECGVVPAMAYLEWCGIKLNVPRWQAKMKRDQEDLAKRKQAIDTFVIKTPILHQFTKVDLQGDLFSGYNSEPQCTVNWDSSKQVIKIAKLLGFDTNVEDKDTGEDKDTVLEKYLSKQKGINDEFLKLYFEYKESSKVVSTYGQGHIDLINPITGRIHTTFKQLGAKSGRMSSGGGENTDLAKYKGISKIKYVNLQQLPHDEETRACFISEPNNNFVSCDYSAEESRLGADVYNDTEMRKEFTERSGDTHAMFAWAVFRKECESCGCTSVSEVKKKAPQWRNKVKSVEFAYLFGAAAPTIASSAGCSKEQAQKYIDDLDKFFAGRTSFTKKGSKFVREHGYVVISPITGHKLYWWDWEKWKERQASFNSEFWDDYKLNHKGKKNDPIAEMVRKHFQAASKYDRYALNAPTQGQGAIIMKTAMTKLFNWIIDNGYFDKVKLCVVVHDEINCEYPKELEDFPNILSTIMKDSAAIFCKSLEIPACPEVSDHWVH